MSFGSAVADVAANDQCRSDGNTDGTPPERAVSNIPAGASEDVSGD